jgi:leucyl/phenylalanyl-tRNA--protein transferase
VGNSATREYNERVHRANVQLDPETLLSAYAQGAFPMADRHGVIRWFTADPRGVFPLDHRFHIPRTLRQIVRQRRFELRINHDFEATMRACKDVPRGDRESGGTWISDELVAAYVRLHDLGFAHSVECWRDGKLAGGLYGVSLGGAFFGESMFHRERDASKVALVHLVARLIAGGFVLLDTQFVTDHLRGFGAVEVPRRRYRTDLDVALLHQGDFAALPIDRSISGAAALEIIARA